jgi:hypothetical protein
MHEKLDKRQTLLTIWGKKCLDEFSKSGIGKNAAISWINGFSQFSSHLG